MRPEKKTKSLSRYFKDYKHTHTHCAHCDKVLDRIVLVFRDQIINKMAIAKMDQTIDGQSWLKIKTELTALCRFCSDIYCNTHPAYFDIMAFKQYLFQRTSMSHSTIREYVVRLRRLDELLQSKNYPAENLREGSWQIALADQIAGAAKINYLIALRKYDQYLGWQTTHSLQVSNDSTGLVRMD